MAYLVFVLVFGSFHQGKEHTQNEKSLINESLYS